MAIYTLLRRWRTGTLALIEAESRGQAIEQVAKARISLAYADLRGLDARSRDLREADLRGADLEAASLSGAILQRADLRAASIGSADLRGATLRYADLRRSNVRRADFRWADLRGADFAGADVRDVCATGSRLDGARLDWRWSSFILELLRRDVGNPADANPLIAELAFTSDERPYAWLKPVIARPGLIDWVVSVIGRAVQPGDGAPEVLRRLTMDSLGLDRHRTDAAADETSVGFYWTRAVHSRKTPRRGHS